MTLEIRPVVQASEHAAPEFISFPSIARLSRACVVTEKLDGTNASIHITDDNRVYAGSRNRWVTPESDNFGFARWVQEHFHEILQLGPGTHYGEWWGQGIQRGYDLKTKRFSLFNVSRWILAEHQRTSPKQGVVPGCIHVVPVLYMGMFDTHAIDKTLESLRMEGSVASPGFMNPEGIVIFHEHSRVLFKKTLDNNDEHKGTNHAP